MTKNIKFSIENRTFVRALKTATRVINRKNALPLLSDVKLTWDGTQLLMTSGNSEAFIAQPLQEFVVIEGPAAWALCCNPDMLIRALGEIGDRRLTVTIDQQQMLMTVTYTLTEATGGQFSVPTESADEYPEPAQVLPIGPEQPTEFHLPAQWLMREIRNASVSVGNDTLRPVMNNVCLDADQEGLHLVSSDGHTLYTTRYEWGLGNPDGPFIRSGEPRKVLVDKQILGALCDAFKMDDDITIRSNGHQVALSATGGILITCVCCESKYPNWRSVIPSKELMPYEVTVEARALVAALKRVSPFSDDSSNLVRLTFDGNRLTLLADDVDFSRAASEDVLLQSNTLPKPLTVGLKSSWFTAMLQVAAKTDNVILQVAEPSRPVLIHPEDRNDATTALVMPMLLNG